MNFFSFFLASFILAVFVKEAVFLECYVCDSTKDSGCEHPDDGYVRYCGPETESTTVETVTEYPTTTTDSESTNESPSSENPTSINPSETTVSEPTTESSSSVTNTELSSSETTDSESATDSTSSDITTTLNPTETSGSETTFDSSASDSTIALSPSATTISESKSTFSDTIAASNYVTITREAPHSSPILDITAVEEITSESALESSSTDKTDTMTIPPESKSLQRKRRSLVAKAADQLIKNYRLIDRNGSANSDSYACFTFTNQGKTTITRGCVAITPMEDGCTAVRDQLNITDNLQGDCYVCLMDRCNSGSSVKISIVVISFVMIAKLIL